MRCVRGLCVVSALLMSMTSGCVTKNPELVAMDDTEGVEDLQPALSLSTTRVATEAKPAQEPATSSEKLASVGAHGADENVSFYRLQAGDPVVIHLRGIYPKDEAVEDVIDEFGNVTIPHIGDIPAIGKSTAQLESEIRKLYIDGGYYRSITVNVVMPQRTFFIRGEVKGPGRYPVVGGLTLMQAIAAAGGYTEFANPRNVKLIRGGATQTINVRQIERNPETDIRLESGDVVVVERSMF